MKRIVLLFALAVFCWSNQELLEPQSKIRNEIQDVLNRQKAAWNNRDIDGFMAYYLKSDELTFQSGNNRVRGWQALLERYKKNYSDENWGTLDFTELEIKIITEYCAYVLGRWKLLDEDVSKEGLFTIILRRFPEGWQIIHDHTS